MDERIAAIRVSAGGTQTFRGPAIWLALALTHNAALGQCNPQGGDGPDVIVGDIAGTFNYTSSGALEAVAFGFSLSNIGTQWLNCSTGTNQHALTTQSLYKLSTAGGYTTIEQLGQSWAFHEFFELSQLLSCPTCTPTNGTHLGVGCASANSASVVGSQNRLAPRWQVNAATGAFAFPPANPAFSGSVARRLQVRISDLEPTSPTTRYLAELLTIAPDDAAAGNATNNASSRGIAVTGSGIAWNFTLAASSTTAPARPAILAWKESDPGVTESIVDVAGDGRFIVCSRATDMGGGVFHYEYAAFNLTSDRSCDSFSVPVSTGVSAIGFHDVDYHDGDGPGDVDYSNADWTSLLAAGSLTFATESYSANPSANAIRWGTMYNFRFDCTRPPSHGQVTLGLFKPGIPASVVAGAVVPSAGCPADFNADGSVDFFDYDNFVTCFEGLACPPGSGGADFNHDSAVDFFDYDAFVLAFETPC
ncbi:MAG: hypothetical protein AABZ53_01295 [Planctomycetota bacterium]